MHDEKVLKTALEGRKITGVRFIKKPKSDSEYLQLTLDNQAVITVQMEGGPGIDGGWYLWLVVKINGKTVANG